MRSDGRNQGRNSADGCGEDRATIAAADRTAVPRLRGASSDAATAGLPLLEGETSLAAADIDREE